MTSVANARWAGLARTSTAARRPASQGGRTDRGRRRNQDGPQPAVPCLVGGGVIGRCDGTLDPGARGGDGAGHVGLLSEPAKGPEQASWEGYTTRGATEAIRMRS